MTDAAAPFADDFRYVPCERCLSEGRLYGGHPNDPNPRDDGECPNCGGTGEEMIPVEPITLDDLCANGGCQYASDVGAPPGYSCVGVCQYRAHPALAEDA